MRDISLVVILLLGVSFGCRWPGGQSNSETNGARTIDSTSSPTVGQPPADPRQAVIAASKKFLDLPKFSAKMDGAGKQQLHIDLKYVAPDRYHVIYSVGGPPMMEAMIMIGKDMYVKSAGRWQKASGPGTEVPNIRKLFDENRLESLQDVRYVGDDTVAGELTRVYSYRNALEDSDENYPFTSKIWVGSFDELPRKIEVTYDSGDLKTMTILYDLKSDVTIEPPVSK
jgi:hypothetical protein